MQQQRAWRDRNLVGIRWTCAAALVLLGVGALFGVRLAVRAGEAFGFVSILAAMWQLPELAGFRVSRTLTPGTIQVGDSARMRTEVSARHLPWFQVTLSDRLPEGCQASGPPPGAAVIVPGIPYRTECRLDCTRRGVYAFDDLTVEGSDLFGLGRRALAVRAGGALVVAPRVFPLRTVGIDPRRLHGELRVRRGLEDELGLAGVRAYVPGDPFRRIHWRQTARTGALQVRDLDPSAGVRALCMVDLSGAHRVFADDEPLVETVLSAAASLFTQLAGDGVEVGLYARDPDRTHSVPIRAKALNVQAAMTALAAMRAGADVRFGEVLRGALPLVPRDAVPVIFCSSVDAELARLAAVLVESGRRPLWVQVVRGPYGQALKAQVGQLANCGVHCHHVFGLGDGRWAWEPPRTREGPAMRRA